MQCIASFYDEKSSPNKTVSLLGSVVCPDCNGHGEVNGLMRKSDIPSTIECSRCGGDGLLTNQLAFNSNLLECACAPSFMKENGLRLGDIVRFTYNDKSEIARLVDYMSDEMWVKNKRGFDLNKRVFSNLEDLKKGIILVDWEKI